MLGSCAVRLGAHECYGQGGEGLVIAGIAVGRWEDNLFTAELAD